MTDLRVALDRIVDIIRASSFDLSLPERCALYSAARYLLTDIDAVGKEDHYLAEKAFKTMWHIGASLGFDVDNDQTEEQHRVQALGQFTTLKHLIRERFPDDFADTYPGRSSIV